MYASVDVDEILVVKGPTLPSSVLSVTSTIASYPSHSKSSFCDLTALGNTEQLLLPNGAFENWGPLLVADESADGHFGKFAAKRMLSRELSMESADEGSVPGDPKMVELFTNLLKEADRISACSGTHAKTLKLTTSKVCPYKQLLRRTW